MRGRNALRLGRFLRSGPRLNGTGATSEIQCGERCVRAHERQYSFARDFQGGCNGRSRSKWFGAVAQGGREQSRGGEKKKAEVEKEGEAWAAGLRAAAGRAAKKTQRGVQNEQRCSSRQTSGDKNCVGYLAGSLVATGTKK